MQKNENNIIIYQDEDGITKISVRFSDEDLWLTQNQIAEIYKTTKQNVSLHINNIYEDKELDKDSTVKKYLTVQNKLHFAVHEHTAAEIIYQRVDNEKPFVGMTNFKGDYVTVDDVKIAGKNISSRSNRKSRKRI